MPEMSSQKKFPWIWIILPVVIIIGFAGFYFYTTYLVVKPFADQLQDEKNAPDLDSGQYNWSTMNEGPYKDKISFATSTDLLNWTDQKTTLAEHASVPDVALKDSTLYVYFVDVAKDGIKEQVGLIKSTDQGKTWSEKQIVTIKGLGNKAAVDPTPNVLADGTIRLYYLDLNATRNTKGPENLANNTIYYADSVDGINFTEKGAAFKYAGIFDPSVIKVGDTWHMYVGTDDQKVLTAVSTNGSDFAYEGVAAQNASIPDVILKDQTYYLFTGGVDIFTSSDGKTFTKTTTRFDSGRLTADPGVVQLADKTYLMVYKTSDKMPGPKDSMPKN